MLTANMPNRPDVAKERVLYERNTAGYSICYCITSGRLGASGASYYGVAVVKRGADGDTEQAAAAISEEEGFAVDIAKALYDAEVTPVTFYDVIDLLWNQREARASDSAKPSMPRAASPSDGAEWATD